MSASIVIFIYMSLYSGNAAICLSVGSPDLERQASGGEPLADGFWRRASGREAPGCFLVRRGLSGVSLGILAFASIFELWVDAFEEVNVMYAP